LGVADPSPEEFVRMVLLDAEDKGAVVAE